MVIISIAPILRAPSWVRGLREGRQGWDTVQTAEYRDWGKGTTELFPSV